MYFHTYIKMKTEIKIIKTMLSNHDTFTIRSLSNKINSDYKITHTATRKLIDKQIIKSTKIGHSNLCNLNIKRISNELFDAELERRADILKNSNILQVYKEIMSHLESSMFTMILFGSHAKNKFNAKSDVDLLFITNERGFESDLQKITSLLPLDIHSIVLTEKEFKRMYNAKQPNIVTEVSNYYIILYGIELYYNLILK